LVARLSEDQERAWVLIEWMRQQGPQDRGAIQGEAPREGKGVEALSQSGVEVGDEVLVDLRPLPVSWLSFLFFGVPLLLFAVAALVGQGIGTRFQLHPSLTIILQMSGGLLGMVFAYRYADGTQVEYREQGLGTPVITAIMPRFKGEGTDTLQALFRLSEAVPEQTWAFASEELDRVTGVLEAKLVEDRVEIIFQKCILKEKHLLELLLLLGIPILVERDLG
jgi:positive regulator of sigma E activity